MKVIGISGVSGAGKTTLAKALAKNLKATSIFWDDFDEISTSPDDLVDWHKRGGKYEEWDYSAIVTIINSLKNSHAIMHPTLNYFLVPSEYLIFDAPLGRLHKQTGSLINFCMHIEVPLDISLCRRILRDFSASKKSKEELLEEVDYYLKYSRNLFLDSDLKKSCDLILDGTLEVNKLVEKIKNYLIN